MVLRPEKEAVARTIFGKWDLDFAVLGETIAEDRFLLLHNGETKADLPLRALSGSAPEYDRPRAAVPAPAPLGEVPDVAPLDALRKLLSSPNHCARNWVFEQYDHMVLADTLRRPGQGAGVVRVHGTGKALAFTADVTPRYCAADPREGGKQAVAEAFRNLCAVGARPLAATDCLNFGNPEKPEIMGQFAGCIEGLAEACRALDMPIVSGNVSLYNETDGRAILPTPTIGAVGLLESLDQMIAGPAQPGDVAVLLGETRGHLGQSALLWEIWGRAEGAPPPVDLTAERLAGEFLRARHGQIRAATDLSDGGLALAAFEMAVAAGCGVQIEGQGTGWFFGEDQGRYLLAAAPADADALLAAARAGGVPARAVGRFGGADFTLDVQTAAMDGLVALWRGALAEVLG